MSLLIIKPIKLLISRLAAFCNDSPCKGNNNQKQLGWKVRGRWAASYWGWLCGWVGGIGPATRCDQIHHYPVILREDVKIPTYKPHANHKRSSVRSHTLAPTTICDLSYSLCWSPLTDLGHINSVTYVCHPLWFVCGHRKGILTSPLSFQTNIADHRRS